MRKLFTGLFLLLVITCRAQIDADSAWIVENFTKNESYIPMRDGVKLFTSLYIPKDSTSTHPIIMIRTPYSCSPYGKEFSGRITTGRMEQFAKEKYIIVFQDVRGKWMSEGEFMDVRPFNKNKKTNKDIDEASDTYDAIEWLIKNIKNNNGNVGIMGTSYPGFYATMAAASGHPALKAVSPQAPVTDWFMGDDFHHNGAFFQMDGFVFYSSFGKPRPQPTTVGAPGFDFKIRDNYKFYLQNPPSKLMEYLKDSVAFWRDIYAHPNYDDWWQARNARRAMYNIKPAMLVVGGLFDAEDCYGAWNLYKAIEKQNPGITNKIVMGPWSHGQWGSHNQTNLGNIRFGSNTSDHYQTTIEFPFFQYYLNGKGPEPAIPEASIFFTGENKWRQLDQWPPKENRPRPIYLAPEGSLSWNLPTYVKLNSFSEYVSDPAHPVPYTEDVHFNRTSTYMTDDQRFATRRPDVLSFTTYPLEEDLTLAGPVIADLKVSLSGTDADFVVKVIDVFPDDFSEYDSPRIQGQVINRPYPMRGYEMLVRGEIMRGKFRNSFEKPVPFKPGKIETVKFELPDIAHTFKKGHRLMIQIQSSWFPLADRNPQQFMNIYEAKEADYKKATIRIHHDQNNPSSIHLPILR